MKGDLVDWWTWKLDGPVARRIVLDARKVAEADTRLDSREIRLLDVLENLLPTEPDVEPVDVFTEPSHKRAYLRALLMVAWADAEMHATELTLIRELAALRGIDGAEVDQVLIDVSRNLVDIEGLLHTTDVAGELGVVETD